MQSRDTLPISLKNGACQSIYMSKTLPEFNISDWVKQPDDVNTITFRKAVHTILVGISGSDELRTSMIMKGGILLALRYGSTRYTKDIDFSTGTTSDQFDLIEFETDFNKSLVRAVNSLDYGLDCVVQTCKKSPPKDGATFPTIKISIGYAYNSETRSHKRLMRKQSTTTIKVDYSLNEPSSRVDSFEIDEKNIINTYTLTDLIAEKLRAILQQSVRNRNRRQDSYDLWFILKRNSGSIDRSRVLHSLQEKSKARDLEVAVDSMANLETRRRSEKAYKELKSEIEGEFPPFDEVYRKVQGFYEELPW